MFVSILSIEVCISNVVIRCRIEEIKFGSGDGVLGNRRFFHFFGKVTRSSRRVSRLRDLFCNSCSRSLSLGGGGSVL